MITFRYLRYLNNGVFMLLHPHWHASFTSRGINMSSIKVAICLHLFPWSLCYETLICFTTLDKKKKEPHCWCIKSKSCDIGEWGYLIQLRYCASERNLRYAPVRLPRLHASMIAVKSDCRFFDITWWITIMVLFRQGSSCRVDHHSSKHILCACGEVVRTFDPPVGSY